MAESQRTLPYVYVNENIELWFGDKIKAQTNCVQTVREKSSGFCHLEPAVTVSGVLTYLP